MYTLAILAVVLSYTWVIEPIAPKSAAAVAGALVIGLAVWRAIRSSDWGVKPAAFLPSLWQSALVTAVAGLVIYLAGSQLGTWRVQRAASSDLLLLTAWGLGQQFALHTVFLREAQTTMGRSAGIVVAAALFAALHLPNPLLSAMTFAGALAWCWIYDRHPNLLPLALSHALLTLAILRAFDGAMTGHLRVGAAYLSLR